MNPIFPLLWGKQDVAAQLAGTLSDAAWQQINFHGSQHRLRPLLHSRAKQGSWTVPADILDAWQQAYRRSAMRSLQQRAELARIGAALKADGISALVLKGGAFLGQQSIDAALRPMRDLDVLVATEHLLRANDLLCAMGYRPVSTAAQPSAKHLPELIGNGVCVELHQHIFDSPDQHAERRQAAYISRCWDRAIASATPDILAFSPADALLHLIWHAVIDHQFNNGPLLMTDIQRLTANGQIDWPLFWHEAKELQIIRPCQLALHAGEKLAALAITWCDHIPLDLPNSHVERVAQMMLIDMDQRSTLGWPGQLARLPIHRWPGTILQKLKQRKTAVMGDDLPIEVKNRTGDFSHLFNASGRKHIGNSITIGRWLTGKNAS